jgi:hypothetical protein
LKKFVCIGVLLFLHLFWIGNLVAQITVTGVIKDKETKRVLSYAFVINQRTQNGVFADQKGQFTISALPTDSLLFSLTGYNYTKVFLKDSIPKTSYNLTVYLSVKSVQLRQFTIKAPKTYDQIIRELEIAERTKIAATPLADAVSSPITFLYNQFSKEGKARTKIAALRSEDAKMELLRELFTRYMVAHIIDIDELQVDDFIKYSNLTNNYTQFETEYELVVYVKELFVKYKQYRGIED